MQGKLIYFSDSEPGITRRRCGQGFTYFAPDGTRINDTAVRERLVGLAVPPAYTDVWMCPSPDGHLQATGRDARARKQYRYHPQWQEEQAQVKFDQLIEFGLALPRLRRRLRRDLAQDAGEQTFALAAATTLIDRAALRVGNPIYAAENGSYGALTLRNKHVKLNERHIALRFNAKGGKRVRRQLADRTLARVLNKISDLPGARLLSWLDGNGVAQAISSDMLNRYIADAAAVETVTAKTFRTWAGTLAAFEVGAAGDARIKDMASAAAKVLHNTPKIARDSYIHPRVIALADMTAPDITPVVKDDLRVAEQRLLGFLQSGTGA